VSDVARAGFDRVSGDNIPFAGALVILLASLILLVRAEPGVVVWLRTIFDV
jgi:hypothetical protein